MHYKWVVNSQARLLPFVRKQLPSFSIKDVRWSIEHHRCLVNKRVERFCSKRLNSGDIVELSPVERPQFMVDPARILFDDETLFVYDKPANFTSEELSSLLGFSLVHRLDRDTTGVILFAKTKQMQTHLETLFADRKIEKSYLAIVLGTPKQSEGTIEKPIGKLKEKEGEGLWGIVPPPKGKYAKTKWIVERTAKDFSLIRCTPVTGRTHQIKIHLSAIGLPILGDLRYGTRKASHLKFFRPLLHAQKLSFSHPITSKQLVFTAPLPDDLTAVIEEFLTIR